MSFTHLTHRGEAHMVDVTAKTPTVREAAAIGEIACSAEVLAALREGRVPKGDVLAVARIAGISAAKKVPELLPLAHTIGVHGAKVDVEIREEHIALRAEVRTADRTGVEMEALTAVSVAALAIIDMVKGVDRSAYIRRMGIVAKSGGRSGDWSRELPHLVEAAPEE
ncbi:cyclic pyranopterin monophosphate synthase MoaC [Corynebacterium uropygiale]|uniref:cyclic pyranopterin monophosphate synthase n=1 Tax=Corynebacterium uropygiale TaxID=1775911 RepID=A0A9X1QR89_9CORY|nr:cyclic pyranopterin monophosphate synthase MoaC [Corynebacterium uropygiale]